MEFFIDNWYLVLAAIALITVAVVCVVKFFKLPTNKQLEQIVQWLIYAVAEAEEIFGSTTGQMKLRYVYDLFLSKFPWLAKIISFDLFSDLVDIALEDLEKILNGAVTPENIEEYLSNNEE